MRPVRNTMGFTLIELLVAIFISAIMMALGYSSISQAINGRRDVELQAARLLQVQRGMRTLEQDITLLQPRPVRNPIGDDYQAALVANTANAGAGSSASGNNTTATNLATQATALLSLTRGGWSNPAGVTRPELQRVSYLVEDNKLVRYHLPVVDAVGATATIRRELIDNVESISFRFMDAGHNWRTIWQPGGTRQALRARPVAVEITLVLKDWGTLTRIVEIAG
jgi:general secretion pathway protein J